MEKWACLVQVEAHPVIQVASIIVASPEIKQMHALTDFQFDYSVPSAVILTSVHAQFFSPPATVAIHSISRKQPVNTCVRGALSASVDCYGVTFINYWPHDAGALLVWGLLRLTAPVSHPLPELMHRYDTRPHDPGAPALLTL